MICLLVAAALAIWAFNAALAAVIHDAAIAISRNKASNAMNEAVIEALDDTGYTYSDFIEIARNADGSVQSVSAKSDSVNRFRSELGRAVLSALEYRQIQEFSVPLGTLTDIGILYGRGPDIEIRLGSFGDIDANLESSFVSVGINQTKHRITCEISANITVITPSFTENINVKSEYLIAETVIVGEIPDSYTDVNGDDSGIIGQVFDYADVG